MKIKGGIFVYAQDIMKIKDVSLRTAVREIRLIRDVFDKEGKDITIFDVSKYWDVELEDLISILNEIR